MTLARKILLAVALLALLSLAWLWWNRPQKVDMAGYVPAESLVYIEANSLPDIFKAMTSTDAWKKLAPAAGIKSDAGRYEGLTGVAAWTGIGSAEAVILSRAQVAVVVLGFQASEEADASLKITPRAALVVETHTGEGRVRPLVERLVGDMADKLFGPARMERRESGGAPLAVWISLANSRRKVVAGVSGSVAVIGNDETAVLACFAAQRGERPSLAGEARLSESRDRVGARDSLAFGYAPSGSAAKILESTAPLYVEQVSEDARTQSILASVVPRLADRLLRSAAWSTRVAGGAVEDRYFIELPEGVAARLQTSFAAAPDSERGAVSLLPADAYQISRYSYAAPEAAWGGFHAAISSQVDALHAPLVSLALEAMLKPYGIESPREFLRAAGGEIVTARLDAASESKLLIVSTRDAEALRAQVRKRLGAGARVVTVGRQELIVSTDPDEGAASFVGGHLIMGAEEDVRRCLAARDEGRTLDSSEPYAAAFKSTTTGDPAQVTTLSDDEEYAAGFVGYFAARRNATRDEQAQGEAVKNALAQLPYSLSETRLGDAGFEKRTRSSFGLLGVLVTRYGPPR